MINVKRIMLIDVMNIKVRQIDVDISAPRDRDTSLNPKLIKKHKRVVSEVKVKVISMYAKSMSQHDISSTIKDIHAFSVSHIMISDIAHSIIP